MKDLLKENKGIILFYCFMFVFLCLQTLSSNTIDPDYWARLLQGNAFIETGHLLKQDIFSFTQTHLWLDHEWGASVVFALFQKYLGFKGILVLRTLIAFLIFVFIFKTIKIRTEQRSLLTDVLLFTASALAIPTITQSGLRCHFFTFLFFAIFLYILEIVRNKSKDKLLFFLPLIMLFWSNSHGGCVSGLGLIGMYAAGEFLNKKPFKKYLFTLFVSIGVMFINPYGIDFVKFIFMASTMARPNVTEWLSPFVHPVWSFMLAFKILFVLNALILIINLKNFKTDFTKYIILIVCLIISARNVKSTPFFIITSMIFFYDYYCLIINKVFSKFPKLNERISASILMIVLLLVQIPMVSAETQKSYLREQPLQVVEFLKVNALTGKVLAPPNFGSYIAYKLFPDMTIYMDGRYEEVYFPETSDIVNSFYLVKEDWAKILEFEPDYIIIPADGFINDYMEKRDDYKLIYANPKEWLYARADIAKDEYNRPNGSYKYYETHAFETNVKF